MTYDKYVEVDKQVPKQTQDQQPGIEAEMEPAPIYDDENYKGSGKLKGKNALITGGDSGIGRAVAVAYAKEGANVAIGYLDENEDVDANKTIKLIESLGVKAVKIRLDISEEENCERIIDEVIKEFSLPAGTRGPDTDPRAALWDGAFEGIRAHQTPHRDRRVPPSLLPRAAVQW